MAAIEATDIEATEETVGGPAPGRRSGAALVRWLTTTDHKAIGSLYLWSAFGFFLIVSALIFWILEVLPGDVASRILGRDATPETLALLRALLHLDDPALTRYLRWLGGMATGDFGTALTSSRPIVTILEPRILNTVLLAGYAFLIYLPLALIPALIQAVRRDRPAALRLSLAATTSARCYALHMSKRSTAMEGWYASAPTSVWERPHWLMPFSKTESTNKKRFIWRAPAVRNRFPKVSRSFLGLKASACWLINLH